MSDDSYLLDTNVVSEARRSRPDSNVVTFLRSIRERHVCLSVLSIGELEKGAAIKRRSDPLQGERLMAWVETVERSYEDRILPVDREVARLWGRLSAARPRPIIDTLIAATAIVHGMTLVTRNVADMKDTGVPLIDPWAARGQEEGPS